MPFITPSPLPTCSMGSPPADLPPDCLRHWLVTSRAAPSSREPAFDLGDTKASKS